MPPRKRKYPDPGPLLPTDKKPPPEPRKVDAEFVRQVKAMSREDFVLDASDLLSCTLTQLAGIIRDRNQPASRVFLAASIFDAVKEHEPRKIQWIYDQLIGKPTEGLKLMGVLLNGNERVSLPVQSLMTNPAMAENALALAEAMANRMGGDSD